MMTAAPPPGNGSAGQCRPAPRNEKPFIDSAVSRKPRPMRVWIRRPVERGEHLNDWLFGRAKHLAHRGATADSVAALLQRLVGNQTRPGEIKRQVERGFLFAKRSAAVIGTKGGAPAARKWPLRDDSMLVRLWQDHPSTVDELAALSPHRAPDHPVDVLRQLHDDDNALLCLAPQPVGGFQTRTLGEWKQRREDVRRWEMVVPSPMLSAWALNDEGNPSARCRNNSCGLGGQRFLVLEFDIVPTAAVICELGAKAPDVCASIILHKLGLSQVRMIVHSGSKSLQCWLPAGGRTQDQINRFYRVWCTYAGDWRGSLPEQQFRLPQGWRADKNAPQRVVYFNPEGGR
jgi:hypothetical protein